MPAEEGSWQLSLCDGERGPLLGGEVGRVLPRSRIQAFRKVLLEAQGQSPDWAAFSPLFSHPPYEVESWSLDLGHLSLQNSEKSFSFMCSLFNLLCSVAATEQSRARPIGENFELQ